MARLRHVRSVIRDMSERSALISPTSELMKVLSAQKMVQRFWQAGLPILCMMARGKDQGEDEWNMRVFPIVLCMRPNLIFMASRGKWGSSSMVKDIVSGIVTNGGEYLVLKRSLDACSPGEWEFVSGFIEKKESPEQAVLREVREETGLAGKILRSYRPIVIFGTNDTYLFRPYLIEVMSRDVLLSEEHIEMKWVGKDCLRGYMGLVKDIAALIS